MSATEYWTARGAVIEDRGGWRRLTRFGDPDAEARLAAGGEATCAVPLLATTPLRISGSDRAAFLHGQLSNSVEGVEAGGCNHTLQLNARGQVVGEAELCVRDGDVFLAVEDGRGPQVLASLQAHIVFDDVQIEDLGGTLAAVSVQGPGAADVVRRAFGEAPAAGRFVQPAFGPAAGGADGGTARVLVHRRRRSPAGGFDVHLLAAQLPAAVEALEAAGAELVGETALTLMRVLGGVPSAAGEGAAAALPQELGLAEAVSFAKGCYLGQEIMARIEARGAVHKGLRRVRLTLREGASPDAAALAGLAVRCGGREVGRLGTVTGLPEGGLAALAVLRLEIPEPGALAVVDDAGAEVADAEAWPPTAGGGGPAGPAGEAPDPGGVQPGGPAGSGL